MKKKMLMVVVMLVGSILLCPSMSWGVWAEVFYDDFDDGNYNGWTVSNPYGNPGDTLTPQIVASPEGYSIRGVGSGYGSPEAAYLVQALPLNNIGELAIEMRAKSGSSLPSHSTTALFSGSDYYDGYDYGENQWAGFRTYINGQENWYTYGSDNQWHDFKWSRDAQGFWSLNIDGSLPELVNFVQETSLTSFDTVALTVVRNQSEIEWVRISIPEPATLGLMILGGLALLGRDKKKA